ncbi:MAG: GNVR domain-containing protein, partial [Pseudomonadota bacterium]|nr:GNVR domain-containing protein [Pseudomonadota bacterium]
NKELARILASARTEYEIAKGREASLVESMAGLSRDSADNNKVTVRLRELEREAQANRELFNQVLARAKETTEETELQLADARIVSRALVPVTPSSPGMLLILAIAASGGLVVAGGLVLVAENMTQGYRSRDMLERDAGVMCYGLCPDISAQDVLRPGRGSNGPGLFPRGVAGVLASVGGAGHGRVRNHARSLTRYSLDRPHSAFADALRAVRIGLFGTNIKTQPKVVLITSAVAGEGKSTIAANLANDMARSGAMTLLVDADFREGTLTRLLAAPGWAGLGEVLTGRVPAKEAVVFSHDSGLFFLPAGRLALEGDGGDLLTGRAFPEFLRHYRSGFDVIIIDGPPALASTDAGLLMEHADGALFVVEWEKTSRDAVMSALNLSPFNRHKVRGCLLNRADRSAMAAYGYGRRRGLRA